MLASTLIDSVATDLNDAAFERWRPSELLDFLNAAQRQVCLVRPEAFVKTQAALLVSGTKQTLPADGKGLVTITRNMGSGGTTPGTAIVAVARSDLDKVNPEWHRDANPGIVQHFVYDPESDPKTFYVSPYLAAPTYVEIVYKALKTVSVQLTPGTKQTLPAGGNRLLRVVRNMAGGGTLPGRAITQVDTATLDAHNPDWHSDRGATLIRHFVYDESNPEVYHVYPPAHASTSVFVEITYEADITANMQLAAGTKQTLPAGGLSLTTITRNMGNAGTTPGEAVVQIGRDVLDVVCPGWNAEVSRTSVRGYVYEPGNPKVFYVVPSPLAPLYVEMVYLADPTEVTDITGSITIDNAYAEPLKKWMLHLALSKDADSVVNREHAALHAQAFYAMLAAKSQAETG